MRRVIAILFFWLPLAAVAQDDIVQPVTDWLATVDPATQLIHISWQPSSTPEAVGYTLCSGERYYPYDSIYGRLNTSYICHDHLATEEHIYRIFVFADSGRVSELTPPFGNIVLRASLDPCHSTVRTSWNPYIGMPGPPPTHNLMASTSPGYFYPVVTTTGSEQFTYSFEVADTVTQIQLKVVATNGSLFSESNTVTLLRMPLDTVRHARIATGEYDSLYICNRLTLSFDTAVDYTLWRSANEGYWQPISTAHASPGSIPFVDHDINPLDSLYCYFLTYPDPCGNNAFHSDTLCLHLPEAPEPQFYCPNVIVAGDPLNGLFLPVLRGLRGYDYELQIFNRTGLLVYSTTDRMAGWRPSDTDPQGVYTYRLRCRYNNNRLATYIGTVLILK